MKLSKLIRALFAAAMPLHAAPPAMRTSKDGVAAPDKAFETLRAQCAFAGATLVQSTDEYERACYIVSRWAQTRELPDLASVSAWLQQVTGKNAGLLERPA
jgi:hypothetical protein